MTCVVVSCPLRVVCCLLCVVWCPLFAAGGGDGVRGCLLIVVRCLIVVVCCVL